MSLKLSKRLKTIEQMVTHIDTRYSHIWDCCCDHGFLGAALLAQKVAKKIHFVDIVPELIAALEHKLITFYPSQVDSKYRWQTHCIDVANLPLAEHAGRHLIIIAGVGGDLMNQFIEAIFTQNKHLNFDLLLCPVHHQFSLRQTLIALDFSLIAEALVEENKRFYEIIYVSLANTENKKVSPVGDDMWRADSEQQTKIAKQYLDKTLKHYQRMLKSDDNNNKVQNIIDAYKKVSL